MASVQYDPNSIHKKKFMEVLHVSQVRDFFTSLVNGGIGRNVSFTDAVTEALKRVAEVYGIGVSVDTFPIVVENAGPGAIIQAPKGYLKKDRPDIIDDSNGSPIIGEADEPEFNPDTTGKNPIVSNIPLINKNNGEEWTPPIIGEINKLGNADRYCSNCGKRYDDTDSFCTKCGNERKWS